MTNRDPSLSIHTVQNKKSEYQNNFFRILTDNFEEEKYKPRTAEDDRTVVHYGQRKLLLSEIEFLTNVCISLPAKLKHKRIVVIYAGAAPGDHIDLLYSMFPFIKFVLVDPAKFSVEPNVSFSLMRCH